MEEIKFTDGYIQQRLSNFIGSNCRYKIENVYLFHDRIESDFIVQKQGSQYIYEYKNLEIRLHEKFDSKRLNGEWFDLSNSDIDEINNICIECKYDIVDVNLKLE